jgi:hypothetical protein
VSFSRAQLALVALVVLATLCGSALAWAQQGRPSLVPPPPAKKGAPTWHFKLVGGGTWYNNPFFVGAVPGTTWSTNGEASLGHEHTFRSGVFTWSGNGGAFYYPEVDGLNQPTYGGAVSLTWAPGRRSTNINLRQDYQRSNTRSLVTLDPEGLPLPTSGLDNATSSLSVDQKLSRSWEFQAGGTYIYRRYDDPRLIGGDDLGASARLGTRAGRTGLAFLAYQYTSSRFVGNTQGNALANNVGSHQGLIGYQRRPPRGLVLEVAGGVGYVDSVRKAYPSGRAAIAAVGRKASIEARYYRSFGQAFGYGQTFIADMFSALATWTPVRKLTVSADYNYGYRRSPGDEGNTISSWITSGGFGWDVGGGVGFAARYSREHNESYAANVPVNGDRVLVALSYGVDWR